MLVLLTQLRPRDIGLGLPSARGWLGGVAVAPLAIACSLALGAAVYALVIALGGHDPGRQPVEEVIDTLHARLGLGGLVLCAAILPGVVEEALYRGVMLTGLRKHLSPAAAVLVCALLFAVMHLSPWRFLPQLALGCLLGWLTLRTGSCWPAALAHALHNAVLLVVTRLVQHHA